VGYTVDGVHERLGPLAHAALHRNETTPGLRRTSDGTPLATLIRLWLLQAVVSRGQAAKALPELLDPLVAAGVLHAYGDEVCALVDIRPYGITGTRRASSDSTTAVERALAAGTDSGDDHGDGRDEDWWVVADLTPGLDGARPHVTPDHVLGVNSAATTLAQLTVPRDVGRALDLGTGCGVQALHLSTHAEHIVATDVNARALALSRLTAILNGLPLAPPSSAPAPAMAPEREEGGGGRDAGPRLDLRDGSLFEPVDGEAFDLIVTNPPFVISPRGDLAYRDSGLAGDEVCRRIVVEAPRHLTDGGVCQLLANWLHVRGEDWRDRLASWLVRTGSDAWVIQREVSDPAQYVEQWLQDAGHHGAPDYRERYEEWLGWFEAQNVEAVGYGWITLRRRGPDAPGPPRTRVEEWTAPVLQPLGPEVARWLEAVDLLRTYDDEALLAACPQVVPPLDQEQIGRPGDADPEHVVLRQRSGLCRAVRVDTAEAGLVGACDGTLTIEQIVGALATLLDEDADRLRERLIPRVRTLVEEGYLSLPARVS
jgi:methylase of polypeptide subunit release factors